LLHVRYRLPGAFSFLHCVCFAFCVRLRSIRSRWLNVHTRAPQHHTTRTTFSPRLRFGCLRFAPHSRCVTRLVGCGSHATFTTFTTTLHYTHAVLQLVTYAPRTYAHHYVHFGSVPVHTTHTHTLRLHTVYGSVPVYIPTSYYYYCVCVCVCVYYSGFWFTLPHVPHSHYGSRSAGLQFGSFSVWFAFAHAVHFYVAFSTHALWFLRCAHYYYGVYSLLPFATLRHFTPSTFTTFGSTHACARTCTTWLPACIRDSAAHVRRDTSLPPRFTPPAPGRFSDACAFATPTPYLVAVPRLWFGWPLHAHSATGYPACTGLFAPRIKHTGAALSARLLLRVVYACARCACRTYHVYARSRHATFHTPTVQHLYHAYSHRAKRLPLRFAAHVHRFARPPTAYAVPVHLCLLLLYTFAVPHSSCIPG